MLHHKRREGQSEPLQDVLLTSADGAEWEWQAAADIFGLGGGHAEIYLAVGGDFVLAHVEPLRWFIAKAPGV